MPRQLSREAVRAALQDELMLLRSLSTVSKLPLDPKESEQLKAVRQRTYDRIRRLLPKLSEAR